MKDQQVLKVTQKNDKLEKLCRALQIERKELSEKLEGNKDIDGVTLLALTCLDTMLFSIVQYYTDT